ncbi:MAG: HAMP domain-containing sensor histidine kinase [Odoribacter sp.]
MDHILKKYGWVAFGAFVFLLGLQLFILSVLYSTEREKYVFQLSDILRRSIYELNANKLILDESSLNYIGCGKQDKHIIIVKQGHIFRIPIIEKMGQKEMTSIGLYDLRDSMQWNLEALNSIFQKKLKATALTTSIRWVKKDTLGRVLEVFGDHTSSFLFGMKATPIQLGLLDKHLLESDFDFSLTCFALKNWDRLFTILCLLLISGCCIATLYHSIKTEKRAGIYREQFTHTLVHDLKTPVQVIKKDEYLLRRYLPESIEGRTLKLVDTMKEDLEVLSQKIDTLLTTMITADGFKINVKVFELNVLLEKLIQLHRKIASTNKEIIYHLIPSPDVNFIRADPNHLYEALSNLLENAEKYSGEQVKITIEYRKIKSGIQISVKDNGWGMNEENKRYIFEKNYRINEGNGVKGFGLGLYYVEMVVHAHKGKMDVQSEIGKGSDFIITLPQKWK